MEYKLDDLLVVRGNLGFPSIVRVIEMPDIGTYLTGMFTGRSCYLPDQQILRVCHEGDFFEDIGKMVKGGKLVSVSITSPVPAPEKVTLQKYRRSEIREKYKRDTGTSEAVLQERERRSPESWKYLQCFSCCREVEEAYDIRVKKVGDPIIVCTDCIRKISKAVE